MQTNIQTILSHYVFDQFGYIVVCSYVLLLDIPNNFIGIIISIYQDHFRLTLIYWFDRLRLRHKLWPLDHWFDRTQQLLVLCNRLVNWLWGCKEICYSPHLCGYGLVTPACVPYQRIKRGINLLC